MLKSCGVCVCVCICKNSMISDLSFVDQNVGTFKKC